jgi:hypothetical protein
VSVGPDWNLSLRFDTKHAPGADIQTNLATRRAGRSFPGAGSLRGKKRPAGGLGEKGGGLALVERSRPPVRRPKLKKAAQSVACPCVGPNCVRPSRALLGPTDFGCGSAALRYPLNRAQPKEDVAQIRHAIKRNKPYGSEGWASKTVAQFGLENTVRDPWRSGKGSGKATGPFPPS